MSLQGLDYLVADPVDRVERVHGGLKDHRDAAPAIGSHLLFGERDNVGTVEQNLAGEYPAVFRLQLKQGKGYGRFAAAGLADEPKGLAFFDSKGNIIDGADGAGPGRVVHRQVFDGEDGTFAHRRLSLGFTISSSDRPTR